MDVQKATLIAPAVQRAIRAILPGLLDAWEDDEIRDVDDFLDQFCDGAAGEITVAILDVLVDQGVM